MERYRVFDGFTLKIIAVISMIIDHVGIVFFTANENYLAFRTIGRFAFPIYCFLLSEGYFHTKNRLKYMRRLLAFAIISEIPFDLALFGKIDFLHQNVFFELLFGFLTLFFVDTFLIKGNIFLAVVSAIAGMFLAGLLHFDYGYKGICIILVFYFLKKVDNIWYKLFLVLGFVLLNYSGLPIYPRGIQFFAVFALLPIYFYNGKRGINLKYLFYAVYPLHLGILACLRAVQ